MPQSGKKALRHLAKQSFMTPVRRFAVKTLERTTNMQLVPAEHDQDETLSRLIHEVSTQRDMLMSNIEAAQIYKTARALACVPGDMAEVGVYRAASSRLIREAEPSKHLHLFDTFEGLPAPSGKDDAFYEGLYRSSLEDVQAYLKPYKNIYYHKGLFPETAGPVFDRKFSFVHLDVDLYESTLSSLAFFWPRLAPGGAILSHDYSTSPGVYRAFQEFFAGKSVAVFPLAHTQCMAVRTCDDR